MTKFLHSYPQVINRNGNLLPNYDESHLKCLNFFCSNLLSYLLKLWTGMGVGHFYILIMTLLSHHRRCSLNRLPLNRGWRALHLTLEDCIVSSTHRYVQCLSWLDQSDILPNTGDMKILNHLAGNILRSTKLTGTWKYQRKYNPHRG